MSNACSFQGIATLQESIVERPYSITARLNLARAYQAHGYPDLTVGEAYIALLLVDECLGDPREFEDEAYEAALGDFDQAHSGEASHSNVREDADDDERDERVIAWVGVTVKDGM
jgi:hypothetical protein